MVGHRATLLAAVIGLLSAPVFASADDDSVDELLPVDCLLPAQVRQLGNLTYSAARKAVKVSATECRSRGGEYVLYDRASRASTLKAWLPAAEAGDPEAQTYVGEAFERGYGEPPDYAQAAMWYLAAAEQQFARGALNLATLFERGLGLQQDPELAGYWYAQASQYALKGRLANIDTTQIPPPVIKVIEPPLNQRGIKVESKQSEPVTTGGLELVIGQIEGGGNLARVSLNDQDATLLGGGLFRGTVIPVDGLVEVIVTEESGRKTSMEIGLQPGLLDEDFESVAVTELDEQAISNASGRSFALVVGNNDYAHLNDLFTAATDARVMAQVLAQQFGFETEVLIDASRGEFLRALNRYRSVLNPEDQFLVYYAGHGDLDRVNFRGHWLPVNAEAHDNTEWVSNVTVTDLLNLLPSNEVLAISDSCYSGMLSRSVLGAAKVTDGVAGRGLTRVRTSMTSGGVAPVLDGVGGRHSIFAEALIGALSEAPRRISAQALFDAFADRVQRSAKRVGYEQVPEYGPLQFAGHEGGDFIFERIEGQP